jgi:hypothetical protein
VVGWLVALPNLDEPEIVVERFGGRLQVDDHNPNRIEFWLIDAELPKGVSVEMSRARAWRILVISVSGECAVTLSDLEPLVENLPARFEVNHADFRDGPRVTGTTHSFKVPAGTLNLRFHVPQQGGRFRDAVRAACAGHARPTPTLPELLERLSLSVSQDDRAEAWEGVGTLRQLRDWSARQDER